MGDGVQVTNIKLIRTSCILVKKKKSVKKRNNNNCLCSGYLLVL